VSKNGLCFESPCIKSAKPGPLPSIVPAPNAYPAAGVHNLLEK